MNRTRDSQPAQKPKAAKSAVKQAAPAPDRGGAHALPGSPAQMVQLQRQYGNQAVQRLIQRETAGGPPAIQRAGINDQQSYEQPNDVLGVTTDPIDAAKTPEAERNAQVTALISHAEGATADFKDLINGAIEAVNKDIRGGCMNGDKDFKHVTKTLSSAVDKARGRMEGGSVAQMKDVLRGTIKCKTVAAMTKAQQYLDARAAQLMSMTEIKVGGTQKKDGFQPDKRKGAGDMVGYGDIKYLMPVIHWAVNNPVNGEPSKRADYWMYAEIQLMTDAMNAKKMEGGGHTYYDITREVKEGVGKKGEAVFRIEPTDNTDHAAFDLIHYRIKDLERGVNKTELATLLPKLQDLREGWAIEMTKKEYEGLVLAGELIYRKERVEGNIERQGVGA
jgi:hypothetical protein